jgi:hypothetical protein
MKLINEYNVWSNFIYFIAGIYSILIGISYKNIGLVFTIGFILFGILLISNGVVSCIYHTHTPSFNGNIKQKENQEYIHFCDIDRYISISSFIYGMLFFLLRLYFSDKKKILSDPSLYLTILFGVIGIVFVIMANSYERDTETCESKQENTEKCIYNDLVAYDIFHSNWHIFTGVAIIFGITVIKNTF